MTPRRRANRKKYNAIKNRKNRPIRRPSRSETKVISRRSVRLPRSGLRAHSERVARGPRGRSAGLVAIVRLSRRESGDESAGSHRRGRHCESQSVAAPFASGSCSNVSVSPGRTGCRNFAVAMLQPCTLPAPPTGILHRPQHLIQQHHAGQQRRAREMPLNAGCCDGTNTVTVVRMTRVPLRKQAAGAGRPGPAAPLAAVCRWHCAADARRTAAGAAETPDRSARRNSSVSAAASSLGATTNAATRVTPCSRHATRRAERMPRQRHPASNSTGG